MRRIISATQKQPQQSGSRAKYGSEWWDKLLGCRDKGLWQEMQDETRCEGRTQRVWAVVVEREKQTHRSELTTPRQTRNVDSFLGLSQAWEPLTVAGPTCVWLENVPQTASPVWPQNNHIIPRLRNCSYFPVRLIYKMQTECQGWKFVSFSP